MANDITEEMKQKYPAHAAEAEWAAKTGQDPMFWNSFPDNDKPDLSDPETLHTVVTGFVDDIVGAMEANRAGTLSDDDIEATIDGIVGKCADIAYGKDAAYNCTSWFSPDRLGALICKDWNVGNDPEKAAVNMFMLAGNRVAEAVVALNVKNDQDRAKFLIETTIEDLMQTLSGVHMGQEDE